MEDFVCPGSSCTDSSRVRGREAQRTMDEKGVERGWERESPRGPNLHPAKQPRTTLFDWLPAGLPSTPAQSTSPYFSSTLLFASLLHLIAVFLPPLLHCSLFSLYYYILSSSFLTFLLLFVINIMGGGGEGGVCNFIWGMESNILAAYFFKPC